MKDVKVKKTTKKEEKENNTKNAIKLAIQILNDEVARIREERRKSPNIEKIQINYASEMLSHILSIKHLEEVLNK